MPGAYRRLRVIQARDCFDAPAAVLVCQWLDYAGADFTPGPLFLQTAAGLPVAVLGPGRLRVEASGLELTCDPADSDLAAPPGR